MSNVLIIFQSDTEPVEQMALSVAVGAVEAGALIRLRRLAAPDAPEVGHKSYGKLQPADLVWANTIVIGLERSSFDSTELGSLIDLLKEDNLVGARAWTFGPDGPDAAPVASQLRVEEALRTAAISISRPTALDLTDLTTRMKQAGHFSA